MAQADRALEEAFRIRTLHVRKDLPLSYGRLGALRHAQAQRSREPERSEHLRIAERFTRAAMLAAEKLGGGRSAYILHHQLGSILSEADHADEALVHFQTAVELSALWKSSVALPSADSLIASNAELDHSIFDSFVEAAARRALEYRSAKDVAHWTAASVVASEAIRAASLRETQALAPIWREKLAPAYWGKLGQFRAESARMMREGEQSSSLASRLKSEISELEASVGLRFFSGIPENFPSQTSLIHFQERLRDSEILLSFHLGRQESLLWAITKSGTHLYRLEPERVIQTLAEKFREEVSRAGVGNTRFGPQDANVGASRELYQKLFGQLSRDESEKHSWVLSVEGALFELPFSALVTGGVQSNVRYFIEDHSVQVVPSALSLSGNARTAADAKDGRLVAVGDPIYNDADPRWRPVSKLGWTHQLTEWFATPPVQLNRLPGSGREIVAVKAAWNGEGSTVLEGDAASRVAFLKALRQPTSTIHLATHVLSPARQSRQSFVAFSMGADGQPELLATSDVARLAVPGASVFMTGCASGAGEAVDGAGLLGLTRAWMVAGAAEVIATLWQMPDRGGNLVPAFYRNRKSASAADALRLSQVEMLRSGTWQASPAYWASYQLTGGTR
jgi:CHAT domain-containing protein